MAVPGWYVSKKSRTTLHHYFDGLPGHLSACGKHKDFREFHEVDPRLVRFCKECGLRNDRGRFGDSELHPLKVAKLDRRELEKLRDIKKIEEY